ncbi:hypothetical protein TNCV_867651 [Trichonephila clavipes]|nr:hypothetical protein TNCV_867651 [Trichonephila clavipes]
MSDNEQRCAIKFCFRLGHNATETFAKLQQSYGDSVLSKAQGTSFWDTGKHSNGCNRPAEGYSNISEFHQCYEEWKKRLQRCVASEGSYFEGDNVEL